MAVLELRHIYKTYGGEEVLHDISLTLPEGEAIGIAGPNGCGKTTLLKIAARIEQPDSGEVILNGKAAMVPQDNLLLPWKTLRENILLALKPYSLSTAEAERRLHMIAHQLDITEHLKKYPREVSGGTARKAALARALIVEPDILLLDEPYTGLDVASVNALKEALRTLSKEKVSMIIVSHQLAELLGTVKRIHLLSHRPARIIKTLAAGEGALETIVRSLYLH